MLLAKLSALVPTAVSIPEEKTQSRLTYMPNKNAYARPIHLAPHFMVLLCCNKVMKLFSWRRGFVSLIQPFAVFQTVAVRMSGFFSLPGRSRFRQSVLQIHPGSMFGQIEPEQGMR